MGATWKFSFCASQIHRDRFDEISRITIFEFVQNAFKVYDWEKESNLNNYVDDYNHYSECEDDIASSFDCL